ncbi:unnamed protein product [Gongylonema pulchrum]|uniref:Helicase ATP-binding domain-containing protein n=1 Tax=Gongylonema pulchrum TaxID=637853 RepID=A0A183E0N8_9BILA|nr:unnamed protein product [Gongylonema pulchrum]
MEPVGFAHLRTEEASADVIPARSNRKYKKADLDISKLTKLRALTLRRLYYPVNMPVSRYQKKLVMDSLYNNILIALPKELDVSFVAAVIMLNFRRLTKLRALTLRRLYYPVNMPVCRYQKKLVMDSLYNNILIALPKELDVSFVAAVVMSNFRRWFPAQKLLCICANVDSSVNAAKRFMEVTGCSVQDVCIYGNLKKSERFLENIGEDIIFATAENLVADAKNEKALREVCLVVVEDAHRAISGSHPVCELIRNCIFAQARFRVLAYTDCRIEKVGQLQLIVMNLQIDLIRSLNSIKNEVSLALASPRMMKVYVPINDDMHRIAKEMIKV